MNELTKSGSLASYAEQLIATGDHLLKLCQGKPNKRTSNYRIVLSAHFSRAHELYQSIFLLIENERTTDSAVLLRSLANMLINLKYIEGSKEERAVAFLCDSSTQLRKLYEKSRSFFYSIGKATEVDSFIKYYREQEERLANIIKSSFPGSIPWGKVFIADRAKINSDINQIYNLLYSDLSRFEHNDFSAMRGYVDVASCDPITSPRLQALSPILNRKGILSLSSIIFGMFVDLFNAEFKLKQEGQIHRYSEELRVMTGIKTENERDS